PDDQLELLRISGFFHDVGKIGTGDDILAKSERLNDAEYDEIKKHPLKGAQILSAVYMFKQVVPIVLSHHERIDGQGYPQGLVGEQIPLLSRIITVVDAFDAMTSDRQYRSRMDMAIAKSQLIQGKGTQFDSAIVDAFVQLLDHYDDIVLEMDSKKIGLSDPYESMLGYNQSVAISSERGEAYVFRTATDGRLPESPDRVL
ncbi:MAG: HD domain-containing protein, partial [Eubacteriales bacterium]|nr:HD domain-containing protein [Eubacteriales bacterium]